MPSHTIAPGKRSAALDIAKGIAILAIVLGHVDRGLAIADVVDKGQVPFQFSDRLLYLFHLPVFALTAGLFVAPGAKRLGSRSYLRRRVGQFLYLYLVWSCLQGGLTLAAGGLTNSRPDLTEVVSIWAPQAQFWFFGWITTATLLTVAIAPWRSYRRAAALAVVALTSLIMWGHFGRYFGWQSLGLLPIFFLGAILGRQGWDRFAKLRPALHGAFVVGGITCLVVATSLHATPASSTDFPITGATFGAGIAGTIGGTTAVLSLSVLLERWPTKLWSWLARLGRESLAIYTASIIFGSGTRIALLKVGVKAPIVHIPAGLLAGALGPVLLVSAARVLRWTWLFEAPATITGAGAAGDTTGCGNKPVAPR